MWKNLNLYFILNMGFLVRVFALYVSFKGIRSIGHWTIGHRTIGHWTIGHKTIGHRTTGQRGQSSDRPIVRVTNNYYWSHRRLVTRTFGHKTIGHMDNIT